MSASTLDLLQSYEQSSAAKPVKILKRPELSGDTNHEIEQPMTKAETDMFELRQLIHNLAGSVAVQTKTQEQLSASVAVLVQAQSKQPVVASNGSKWTGWIQTGVVCSMLLVSGTNTFKTSEGDLKQELAIQKVKLESQTVTINTTTDRIQSLEYIWSNARQQLAAIGIQIDPKTGNVEIKRGR